MTGPDVDALQAWVGREQGSDDLIAQAPVSGLSATLDYPQARAQAGEALPPLWHWLYFLPTPAASGLDVDGHALRGDFLPPVPLPRRMWASSAVRFVSPLAVGDAVRRLSTIESVDYKRGRSGELVFVTVLHRVMRAGRLAVEERQRLVYRDALATTGAPQPAPFAAQWSRTLVPDPVLLFRFSALTFNSHRIHYDQRYATEQEAYPGLVVQGPLTATLLLDLLERQLPGVQLEQFEFRALRPLFVGNTVQLQGRRQGLAVDLWALDGEGALAMTATATLAG
jgi:3-methylfumaryl-CoA hydratase